MKNASTYRSNWPGQLKYRVEGDQAVTNKPDNIIELDALVKELPGDLV